MNRTMICSVQEQNTPLFDSREHSTMIRSIGICCLGTLGWLAVVAAVSAHPQVPRPLQRQPVALTNAVIHPVSGPVIDPGTLVFDGGKITALGSNVVPPHGAEVIDVGGKHVYPGLFEPLNNMGLIEINSIRATVDCREIGQLNPNVRAVVALNPDSEVIPTTRSNGILVT